nr:alpha2-Macroglobulin [Astacus astacus=freshwater crayfish, hemolymph, Peptide Partial, 18 aa] [Astacus astacus]
SYVITTPKQWVAGSPGQL